MTELLSSGIELMLVGMGIVFIFLTMLVFVIKLMSRFIQRHFPDSPVALRNLPAQGEEPQTIAAISAAVHRYRMTHKAH